MARAATHLSMGQVPALGEIWPCGYAVRPGTSDDADAVAIWSSDDTAVNVALNVAVDVMKSGSTTIQAYVIDDAQLPIGVLTMSHDRPFLQLVFLSDPYRRSDVGTKATSIVVDEFFQSRPTEPWLGVTLPISTAGRALLRRLGFSSSGSGMRITREEWASGVPSIVQLFRLGCGEDRGLDECGAIEDQIEDQDDEDQDAHRVAINAAALHVVSDEAARAVFRELLGPPEAWSSELVRYRMTSPAQDDWVIEGGNWLSRARSLGYVEHILKPDRLRNLQALEGSRAESDEVHRTLSQWLAPAMTAHYLQGIGWRFGSSEPGVTDLRGDGTRADVDLQLSAPNGGPLVDIQVKGSGTLGRARVNEDIREGVDYAITQLPDPPLGPALVVVCAQRGWWLSADADVIETLIGSTTSYEDDRVLLHDNARGRFATATHVSGVVMLDYRRSATLDYGCTVLMNPWATYQLDPAWFPYSRVLSYADGVFSWIRGTPMSTFPNGTRLACNPRG